jgi:hypothetical protein
VLEKAGKSAGRRAASLALLSDLRTEPRDGIVGAKVKWVGQASWWLAHLENVGMFGS